MQKEIKYETKSVKERKIVMKDQQKVVKKLVMQKKLVTRLESRMENQTQLFNTTVMRDEKKRVKKIKMI